MHGYAVRPTVSVTGIMSPSHGFTVSGTGIMSPSHGFTVSGTGIMSPSHGFTVSGTGIMSPSHGFTAKSHGKQNSLNPLIHWSQSLVKHNFLHFRFALVMVLDQYLWISPPTTSTSIFQSFWNSKHRFCYAYSGCLKSYNDQNIYLGVVSIKLF